MTEKKAQCNTVPKDLNELMARIVTGGANWNEAVAKINEATGCKDLASAMRDGWTVEDFWKTLTSDSPAPQDSPPTPKAEPDPTPAQQNNHFTEAPASFNVKAISPAGFDVMLTLRDSDSRQLMNRALGALDWLVKNGFTPTPTRGGGNRRGNNDAGSGEAPSCPTHGKAMKPSQYGGWYCPVKIADDDGMGKAVYCKQKTG